MFSLSKRLLPILMIFIVLAGLVGCGIDIKYADSSGASMRPTQMVTETATPPASPSPSVSASPLPSEEPSANPSTADPSADPTIAMPEVSGDTSSAPSTQPSSDPSKEPPAETANLVPYDGIVEHLFYHPVIAYPKLAFDGDAKAEGLDSYMVTVSEYNKMLDSIYEKNYILVDMNDVWSETVGDDGVHQMVRNTLMIPEGKKPLILSYDDVNYYNYMIENGFPYKLVIKNGELWSYGIDPDGNEVYSQDLDAITILDKFVKAHPDFSLNGAKGCLCLTGYEGILGYRTMTDTHGMTADMEDARQAEIQAVKPIVAMLKDTGWYFGSHSWGHINLSSSSLSSVKSDTVRWLSEVGSIIGSTKLFIYPFGARPDGDDVRQTGPIFKYLQGKGFRVFASVGIESYSKIKTDICAVICDRMHSDGDTLRKSRQRYLMFYDAKDVFDYESRPNYGNTW